MAACQTCMTFDAILAKKGQKKALPGLFCTVTTLQLQHVDSVKLFEGLLQTHHHRGLG